LIISYHSLNFTDGKGSRHDVSQATGELERAGIQLYIIRMGDAANSTLMNMLASYPFTEQVIHAESYSEDLLSQFSSILCAGILYVY